MDIFFLCKPEYHYLLQSELSDFLPSIQFSQTNQKGFIIAHNMPELPKFSRYQSDFIFEQQRIVEPITINTQDSGLRKIAKTFVEHHFRIIDQSILPWTIHSFYLQNDNNPNLGSPSKNIKKLILELVKERLPRAYKRYIECSDAINMSEDYHIVQFMTLDSQKIALTVNQKNMGVSVYEQGISRMKWNKLAPSRSFLKIEEAFWYMNQRPNPKETIIDLGAAPGGWTYSALSSGALVTAVDNGPMKLLLSPEMKKRFTHLKQDGLSFIPKKPVDWLLCDMLIQPNQTLQTLNKWLQQRMMKHFVVNVKLPNASPLRIIQNAKALLESASLAWWKIKSLYHDRQEITLMGSFVPKVQKPNVQMIDT